ncbi:hypothetical protein FNO01nite_00300 [Flavobacterium noncentrifugens]|uniref:Uncharacterized protein n=1 Tax=Flavobacterium noncentrifugens TaxID=1128970 RepID=A0A1G8RCC2_9FLAO|nr:hypothetical protein [Flavobacterium noncentrifugens]GEP49358.1 hypothetical protein FNO01nite_00300 [Flavobacterium noncentrifugens]SDJ14020.1 hypothetical protein SAMN04487935_0039 [Flavobacterium noncentrifugens]
MLLLFMNAIANENALNTQLETINLKIGELNDQKILLLLQAIGFDLDKLPKDLLQWKTILIVVPNRKTSHELKPYRYSIDRIALATNVNAKEINIYDLDQWKAAFKNKTQLQIRNLLKTTFGGSKKLPEDYQKQQST